MTIVICYTCAIPAIIDTYDHGTILHSVHCASRLILISCTNTRHEGVLVEHGTIIAYPEIRIRFIDSHKCPLQTVTRFLIITIHICQMNTQSHGCVIIVIFSFTSWIVPNQMVHLGGRAVTKHLHDHTVYEHWQTQMDTDTSPIVYRIGYKYRWHIALRTSRNTQPHDVSRMNDAWWETTYLLWGITDRGERKNSVIFELVFDEKSEMNDGHITVFKLVWRPKIRKYSFY